jgi:multidrug efflux pump subunit AcrB
VARASGPERLDPARLGDLTLTSHDGRLIPLSQIGKVEVRAEDPILRRRDRTPTITVQSDIDESLQPPQVSMEIQQALAPIISRLPAGYRIEAGGNIEDAGKANAALVPLFPIMIALTLLVIVLQTRSLAATTMVFLTAPLGLVGAVPVLLLFEQPFGFNAILGLIGLAGILMRNTLILIGQIHTNQQEGLDDYHAVVEATVQRARPVILTALAAVLDGAGRRSRLHSIDDIRLLGFDGLYPDRRHRRRHRPDPGLPASALRDLVQGAVQQGRA